MINSKTKIFYHAVQQAGDGIFIADKKGIIKYVNPAFEKITGYSSREAIGKNPRIIKSGKHDFLFYENLWKTISSGKTFRGQIINRKKNGKLFYADHTITPVKDKEGKINFYVGIWKDISAQKEIEKRKDEFISIASHELRTPLTSIKAYIQILKEKMKKNDNLKLNSYLIRTYKQISKMANLIYDLLDVNRIQAGKLPIRKTAFNFSQLLNECISDLRLGSSVKIEYKSKKKQFPVIADRERLEQVIKNIIGNADKFSDKNKKIIVKMQSVDNAIQVSVRDFGIGIARDEQHKIFQRYYQVEQNKTGSGTSFGIGLYLAREIIKMHQGKIWVESKLNKGSIFYIQLPLNK